MPASYQLWVGPDVDVSASWLRDIKCCFCVESESSDGRHRDSLCFLIDFVPFWLVESISVLFLALSFPRDKFKFKFKIFIRPEAKIKKSKHQQNNISSKTSKWKQRKKTHTNIMIINKNKAIYNNNDNVKPVKQVLRRAAEETAPYS